MLKIAFVLAYGFLQTSSAVGVWVRTDGSVVEVSCPSILEYSDTTRLPSGCVAELPGVWLSPTRYKALEVELAEARSEATQQSEYIRILKLQLKQAQDSLLICTAAPPCAPCKDNSFTHQLSGAFIGAAVSAGGCLLWNTTR